MTENEINVTATFIATLANQPNSQEKIKILLTSLLASKKTDFNVEKNTDSSVSTKLIFSQKEINLMPKTFKKEFRTDGCSVSVERIAIHTIFATVEMAMILPPPLFFFFI